MNVSVVGFGYWGSKVIEEYTALRDAGEIDAVIACDLDESRIETTDADSKFRSLDDALEIGDALHVCTAKESHHDIAAEALERGRDVLVEKPLMTDREQAYDLVERASETGRILQTAHIYRFANVVREIGGLLHAGYFNEVYHYILRWTHHVEPLAGTDVLCYLLPHPIDILNFLTGEWPDPETIAGTANGYRTEAAEAATISFQLDGVMTGIQVSWVDPVKRRSLDIAGTDGGARVECVDQTIRAHVDGQVEDVPVESNNTIRAEAENFIEATETGQNTFNSAIVGARAVDSIQSVHDNLDASHSDR